jgi:hypothetical protein
LGSSLLTLDEAIQTLEPGQDSDLFQINLKHSNNKATATKQMIRIRKQRVVIEGE